MLVWGRKVQTALPAKYRKNGLGHHTVGMGIWMTIAGDTPAWIERHQHVGQLRLVQDAMAQQPLGLRLGAEGGYQDQRNCTPHASFPHGSDQDRPGHHDAIFYRAPAAIKNGVFEDPKHTPIRSGGMPCEQGVKMGAIRFEIPLD